MKNTPCTFYHLSGPAPRRPLWQAVILAASALALAAVVAAYWSK